MRVRPHNASPALVSAPSRCGHPRQEAAGRLACVLTQRVNLHDPLQIHAETHFLRVISRRECPTSEAAQSPRAPCVSPVTVGALFRYCLSVFQWTSASRTRSSSSCFSNLPELDFLSLANARPVCASVRARPARGLGGSWELLQPAFRDFVLVQTEVVTEFVEVGDVDFFAENRFVGVGEFPQV